MRIKGNILKARRAFVEQQFGAGSWDRVVDSLPAEDQRVLRGIVTHGAWFDFDLGTRVDEAIVAVLGGGRREVFEEMGRASARENLTTVHKLLVEHGNPQAFMAKANVIYQFYYGVGRREWEASGPNSGVMTTYDADTFSMPDCMTVVGWYKQGLEMCGAKNPKVVETDCRGNGAAVCRYEVSWS